jgi:DnaK suppressor protein
MLITKKFTAAQKEKLELEKHKLEQELSSFAEKDSGLKDNWKTRFSDFGVRTSDQSEETDQAEEYEANLSVEHELEFRLKKIKDALEKIGSGKYGICQKCKKRIQRKRLKANPEADLCIKCAV